MMANAKTSRKGPRDTVPERAGEYLHTNGPQTADALFAAVNFGPRTYEWQDQLQCAISSGWLIEKADGMFDCSREARDYYDAKAGKTKDKPLGKIATVREPINVFTRPALSRKHIPNPRGLRQDIPDWSVRDKASFKSVGGGDA